MFGHQNTCAKVGYTDTQSFKDVLGITVTIMMDEWIMNE
jgi:hypothetical protein